jgi:hypothetical protein
MLKKPNDGNWLDSDISRGVPERLLYPETRHQELNVSFAIRKQTFASANVNDRFGSILVVQVGLQAPHGRPVLAIC